MILLDTQVLAWMASEPKQLSRPGPRGHRGVTATSASLPNDSVAV
jgi:PIN domain nuclease of toxin-antitoxin system